MSKRRISAAMLQHGFHINEATGQKLPIWTCDGLFFSRWSQLVAGTISKFVLVDLRGKFLRSMGKSAHFYSNTSTQTDLHARGLWPGSATACLFPHWRELVAGTVFMRNHWPCGNIFQGQRLNCLIFTAVPTHKWTYRSESIWSESVTACFFSIEVSQSPVLFSCLYLLTLVVLFQSQWLNRIICTAVTSHKRTYRTGIASDLEVYGLFFFSLKSASRWYYLKVCTKWP